MKNCFFLKKSFNFYGKEPIDIIAKVTEAVNYEVGTDQPGRTHENL